MAVDQDNTGSSGGDGGTALAVPKVRPRLLPPYKVLLHNDDVNDMVFVIEKIVELTPLSIEEAIEKMLEAHQTDVAMLLVTHKERAELYCEQFGTYDLVATHEPD